MHKITKTHLFAILLLLIETNVSQAQADTINAENGKLKTHLLRNSTHRYLVYITDTTETKLRMAEVWDRRLRLEKDADGKMLYRFFWDYYAKDTLTMQDSHSGDASTMAPLTHRSVAKKWGTRSYEFDGRKVKIPDADKAIVKDPEYTLSMAPLGFDFTLDLEILPLLPIKKAGQRFAIAFYQPGSPASNYYAATVLRKEKVSLPGGITVQCWALELDYGQPTSKAVFWISEKSRDVVKMRETFRTIVRYKYMVY